ncbi:STAS domain-containing protein [Geodermatophilus sp. SYSU D00815]
MSNQSWPADGPGDRAEQRRSTIRRSTEPGAGSAPGAEQWSAPPVGHVATPAAGDQGGSPPGELPGRITVQEGDRGYVLHLTGDFDAQVLQQFTSDHPVDRLRILAVDVGGLAYIDSAGLAFLARWAQTARADGRRAEIRHATPRFDRVLEISGLTPLFDRV